MAPFIRKSWQSLRRQAAVARSVYFARGLSPWSLVFVLEPNEKQHCIQPGVLQKDSGLTENYLLQLMWVFPETETLIQPLPPDLDASCYSGRSDVLLQIHSAVLQLMNKLPVAILHHKNHRILSVDHILHQLSLLHATK
jgi:hypothetical protein